MTVNGYDLDPLAGLDATDAERAALDDVLAELGEDGIGDYPGLDPDSPEDPGFPGDWQMAGDPWEAGNAIDLAQASEAMRQAEDAEDAERIRPLPEDRIARALDRLDRGTYTLHPYFRDEATQLANDGTGPGCGPRDEYGRCSARFHQSSCLHTVQHSAPTGDYTAVHEYNRALRRGTPAAMGLLLAKATPPEDEDDWLEPLVQGTDVYQAMRKAIGF